MNLKNTKEPVLDSGKSLSRLMRFPLPLLRKLSRQAL